MSPEAQKNLTILVTGATGMVGRNLVAWLLHSISPRPHIIALGRRAVEISGVEDVLIQDFLSPDLVTALGDRPIDIMFHLLAAGVHPSERDGDLLTRINGLLPPRIVQLAAKHHAKAVVITGSSAEYRAPPDGVKLTEQDAIETEKIYGVTKAFGGLMALMQGVSSNIPVGVARIFNVYGPGEDPHRLLSSLLNQLRQGKPVPLSAGTQMRDFIYVDDVCAGLWHLATGLLNQGIVSGAYNLCTGTATPVADFAKILVEEGGFDPALLQFGALPMRPDDIPYVVGDPALFTASSGWKSHYDVRSGIAASIKESAEGKRA